MARIVLADLTDARHAADWSTCTQAYASGPTGVRRPLPEDVLERSVKALASWPTAVIFLAYLPGEEDGTEQVAGVASCFRGWGTFAGRPLINVHDLAVLPHFHRRGVGKALLQAVIDRAKTEGCGKVTLEALTHNTGALELYTGLGFTSQMAFYELRL